MLGLAPSEMRALFALLALFQAACGRIIEVRVVRPDQTESVANFEHPHVGNANIVLASASLSPAAHTIDLVTANMNEMTVVLGNGDTLLELATYLESNPEIASITFTVSVNQAAAGATAAGITSHTHHVAHGGASASFGVAGSSTPMSMHPHLPHMGIMPGTMPSTFGPQAMTPAMSTLGYGMPLDQTGGYMSGRHGAAKSKGGRGGGKSAATPPEDPPKEKPVKDYIFHLSGQFDKNKKKKSNSEAYKVLHGIRRDRSTRT